MSAAETTTTVNRSLKLEDLATKALSRIGYRYLALKVEVVWNDRLTKSAGQTDLRYLRIELNPKLKKLDFKHTKQTLKHELAHVLANHRNSGCPQHGKDWKQACEDLGIPDEPRVHHLKL